MSDRKCEWCGATDKLLPKADECVDSTACANRINERDLTARDAELADLRAQLQAEREARERAEAEAKRWHNALAAETLARSEDIRRLTARAEDGEEAAMGYAGKLGACEAEADKWKQATSDAEGIGKAALAAREEDVRVLVEALTACAGDLEAEIRGRDGVADDAKLDDMHPVSVRRFNRDMNAVREARAALARVAGASCPKCSHPASHHENGGPCWSCVGTGAGCLQEAGAEPGRKE